MQHLKTNVTAVFKVVSAIAYVVFKQANAQPLTEADMMLVTLALSGAMGNWFSADASKQATQPAQADKPPEVK